MITKITIPIHLLLSVDSETAIIMAFLYKLKKPAVLIALDTCVGMSKQKICNKIREHKEFFVKSKHVTKNFHIFTTYALSEEGKKAFEDYKYWL